MTEPCKLYYNSGDLFFEGYLVNGYRQGLGTEYDKSENIMNEGYFSNGCKTSYVEKMIGWDGYWKELDINRHISSICNKDEYGNNQGICCFFLMD